MSTDTAELDGLILQAGGVDAEVAAQGPEAIAQAQEEAAVMSLTEQNTQGVGMILGLAVPLLSKLYPSLEQVYTPDACGAVAASLGPVLAKYNVNLAEWGGAYKEEIGALFVCAPIAWATVQGVKADIAARAAQNASPVLGQGPVAENAVAGRSGAVPGDFDYREPGA